MQTRRTMICSVIKTALCFATLVCVASQTVKAEAIRHSFLGVGKANRVVIVGEDNRIEWKYDAPASDGWVLPNGNVLLALYPTKGFPGGGVVEVDRKTNKTVFEYQGKQREISTAQRLADGRLLVAELGPTPKALILNKNGEVVQDTPPA